MKGIQNNNKKFLTIAIILIVMLAILIILSVINIVFMFKNNKEEIENYKVKNIGDDAYFEENLDIVESSNVAEDNTFSEEEVIKFLAQRGLHGKITTYYDINGNEHDEKEISETSEEKHPDYSLIYKEDAENGSVWNILVIGKEITAYPFEYNVENNAAILNAVLEEDLLTSYDSEENKFIKTKPNDEQLVVTKVEKIDKNTLKELENTKFVILKK